MSDSREAYVGSEMLPSGTNVTVMGWGVTTEGGSLCDILLEVKVDVVNGSDCNAVDSYDGMWMKI